MNLKQIKLAGVKFVDKLILLVLVIFFLLALLQVLVKDDPKLVQLKQEITTAKNRVERNIRESQAPTIPDLAYAEDLRERFAHIPVVEPYRPYVLYPPEPIFWGVFRVIVGEETILEMPEIQLIRVSQWDKEIIGIVAIELLDEDDPQAGRKLKIKPLKATATTPTPVTKLEVEDVDENRYIAHIIVFEKVLPDRPLSPRDPEIKVIRGQALLSGYMDNPSPLPAKTTETVGFRVYRKLAGRPDSEYVLLTREHRPITPDARYRELVKSKLRMGRYATEIPAPGAAGPGEVVDAPVVEDGFRQKSAWKTQKAAKDQQEREKSLVWFLDEGVEAGEKYVYRMVSVSYAFGQGKTRTESEPWVSDVIEIPTVVEFRLSGVAGGAASIRVWKLDYDRDDWDSASFRVTPDMRIGEPRRVRRDVQGAEGVTREYVDVDFDTGAHLVAALDDYPVYQVKMVWQSGGGAGARISSQRVPTLVEKTVPAVVTQGRDGQLRFHFREGPPDRVVAKEKEKELTRQPRRAEP